MTMRTNEGAADYVIEFSDQARVSAAEWDSLLNAQSLPSPFMRLAYLQALQDSQSACPQTGWQAQWISLRQGPGASGALLGAAVLYVKPHSYGEYVFDWSWARAYAQHGLAYYPKATLAVPFTPVPGSRLLAVDEASRTALARAVLQHCQQLGVSSLHVLFASEQDQRALGKLGLMARHTVQFHWHNRDAQGQPYADFDAFLASLNPEKRKKIRQERRKVSDAGVRFRTLLGSDISAADWAFFYQCYARTYLEHGNPPYLSPGFFERMAQDMAEHWLLFIAERGGQAIACSLIALSADRSVAYGRYWGALERVDCLHFEACYYQPLAWCIAHGVARFEGGAQGEHKMARALMPVRTTSMHWIAHPQFADAIGRFLEREVSGVADYLEELALHSPLRQDA